MEDGTLGGAWDTACRMGYWVEEGTLWVEDGTLWLEDGTLWVEDGTLGVG